MVCELSQPFATLPKPQTGINLALSVVDAEGAPVAGAMASVVEMGAQAGATQTTDESGTASWSDLPGLSATLQVNAPGYASVEQSLALEKGDNQTAVTVELQPHGLLLSDACRPEEKLLYIEDLQDGSAQGWNEIDLQVPGWSIEGAPDAPEDLVIAARAGAPLSWFGAPSENNFDHVVWRLHFNYDGRGRSHINFRWQPENVHRRYIVALARGQASLDRLEGENHVQIRSLGGPQGGVWHLLEIGFYDGTVYVFIDGKPVAEWADPSPWEGGNMSLEPYPDVDAVFYYDDLAICELSGPPQTIVEPSQ